MQMQNVTATNSKRFKLRTIKKVLFITVSFNIHSRISVLGLWETETYMFCTELRYHAPISTWSLVIKLFSVFFKTSASFFQFLHKMPHKNVQNLTSPYPLTPRRPADVKRGTLEYVDGPKEYVFMKWIHMNCWRKQSSQKRSNLKGLRGFCYFPPVNSVRKTLPNALTNTEHA